MLDLVNVLLRYVDIKKKIGTAGLNVIYRGRLEPDPYFITLMRQNLVKQERVEGVGRGENSAPKNGIVIVVVDEALIYLHPHAAKIFVEPDDPNALKQ